MALSAARSASGTTVRVCPASALVEKGRLTICSGFGAGSARCPHAEKSTAKAVNGKDLCNHDLPRLGQGGWGRRGKVSGREMGYERETRDGR